nr:hypothetical protein [uncultured Pseudodesulfovibrio sp.]
MLTPKETGGGRAVYPIEIAYSALCESGFSSSATVGYGCTIHFGFKPTAVNPVKPLGDPTNHYWVTIQKVGNLRVNVYKNTVKIGEFSGAVPSTHAAFVSAVLTEFAGTDKGYYSDLIVFDDNATWPNPFNFLEVSDIVSGLVVRRQKLDEYIIKHTCLNFSDASRLGKDSSGNGNDWTFNNATQTMDTPTNNFCVLNPLSSLDNGTVQYSHGNCVRKCTGGAGDEWSTGTYVLPKTGRWAWRVETTAMSGTQAFSGIMQVKGSSKSMVGLTDDSWGGSVAKNNLLPSLAIIMYDADLRELRIMRDDSLVEIWNNGVAVGTVATVSDGDYVPVFGKYNRGDTLSSVVSFGSEDSDWLPVGYLPICSSKLPTPCPLVSATVVDIVCRVGEGEDAGAHLVDGAVGTPIGSTWTYNSDGNLSKAFNGITLSISSNGSQRLANAGPSPMIGKIWDDPKLISRARWYGASNYGITYQHHSREIQFQGSDDGTHWETLGTLTITDEKVATIDYAGSVVYLQHRMLIPGAGVDTVYLIEAQFFTGKVGTTAIGSLGFCPDFVNIKNRDCSFKWTLYDSRRGATKMLNTNYDVWERSSAIALKSFDSNGYSLGPNDNCNKLDDRFIDLCLKAGSAHGFEIVTFDHVSGVETTVEHGFGKPVTFAMVKRRDGEDPWRIYHTALGQAFGLKFDTTAASSMSWSNTATSFGFSHDAPTGQYVAYLFTDSDVFKAFSYVGNGLADGPFVSLGGKLLSVPFLKNTASSSTDWQNFDTRRSMTNPVNEGLIPSDNSAEWTGNVVLATSQGFKVIRSDAWINGAASTVVGLAILESTKYSNAF